MVAESRLDLLPVQDFGEGAAFVLFGFTHGPSDRDQADEPQVRGRAQSVSCYAIADAAALAPLLAPASVLASSPTSR